MKIEFINGSTIETITPSDESTISKRGQYQLEGKFDYTLKGQTRISVQGTPANFTCVQCDEAHAYYDFITKEMICTGCHHVEPIKGKETECVRCKTTYTEYAWFDPDCCPNCRRNFID